MKIDRQRVNSTAGTQRVDSLRAPAPVDRTSGTVGAQPADHVVLSSRTLQVSELQPMLGALPAMRAEMIARLKEQIASGEYAVEPHKLADLLMRAKVIDA